MRLSDLPNFSVSKPDLAVSGAFCLMMSASMVTPRWLAWPVRSAAVWKSVPSALKAELRR